MDRTIICTAANVAAVNALADSLGNGPETCVIALSTTPGVVLNSLATHFGGTGQIADSVAEGLRLSIDPPVNVIDQVDGQTFADHCAAVQTNGVTTPLYRIYEEL